MSECKEKSSAHCVLCFLQVIQKKFSEFQLGIEAGSDLFSRCDQRATQLVEDGSPYSTVIQERQDKLRWGDGGLTHP